MSEHHSKHPGNRKLVPFRSHDTILPAFSWKNSPFLTSGNNFSLFSVHWPSRTNVVSPQKVVAISSVTLCTRLLSSRHSVIPAGSVCVMRTFLVDTRLAGHRLHPIGSFGNTVFVKVSRENSVEIWSLHTLFPESWRKIFEVEMVEVYYALPAFSADNGRIYMIVFGTGFANEDEVSLFEIIANTGDYKMFCLNILSAQDFYSLPFETACLVHGKTGLNIYDRGIVMGDIPFWKVELDEKHFTLHRNDIQDPENLACGRFPIPIDLGKRIFARLLTDNRLVVLCPETNKWDEYLQSTDSHFNLADLDSRGIRETFSRGGGHRVGAVQSPLTIVSDGNTIIAKINHHKMTHFYKVLLDYKKKEFKCIPAGAVRFIGGLEQMFYPTLTPKTFVAVGVRAVGVVQLEPLSLGECSLWALQKSKVKTTEVGIQSGGYSFAHLRQTLGSAIMQNFCV